MRHDIANRRKEYRAGELLESQAPPDPLRLFGTWFKDAEQTGIQEPTGMILATADAEGYPSARVVLLKGVDSQGFRFFTNYESRKGKELSENPKAALVFWWPSLERQIRVEGSVQRLSDADSDAYYHERPRASRLGAWASPQSRRITSREALEERLDDVANQFKDQDPPRPPFWGGFLLDPERVEFWQGRPSRLHDRLIYTRKESRWALERVAP